MAPGRPRDAPRWVRCKTTFLKVERKFWYDIGRRLVEFVGVQAGEALVLVVAAACDAGGAR